MKIGLVIGHTEGKRGALSKIYNKTEWIFFTDFQEKCIKEGLLNFKHEFYIHPNIPSYTKRQQMTAERTKNCDLVLSLHFNSFNGEANGATALYNKDNKLTEKVTKKFIDLMSEEMGIRRRSPIAIDLKDDKIKRGEGFIKETRKNAILLEPFFGDNLDDCAKYDHVKFANVLNKLVEYYQEVKSE